MKRPSISEVGSMKITSFGDRGYGELIFLFNSAQQGTVQIRDVCGKGETFASPEGWVGFAH